MVFLFLCVHLSAWEGYGKRLAHRKVAQSSGCASVLLDNGFLYTVGREGLCVYDVRKNPDNPEWLASLKTIRNGRQMAKCGDYLYIAARNFGLWIVDVSAPADPRLIKRWDTIELATGISGKENLLFVAQRGYGVQILNIDKPDSPEHLALMRTDEAQSVFCEGTLLYVGDWGSGKLTIGDISNPREPKRISQTSLDGNGDGVAVNGNLCYVSTGHHSRKGPAASRHGAGHGVEVFNVADPAHPKKIGGIKFPKLYHLAADFWNVRLAGRFLLASDTYNGFFLLDVSEPSALKCLGYLQLEKDPVSWAEAGENVIYVTGQNSGLYVVPFPGMAPAGKKREKRIPIPPEKQIRYPGFLHYDAGGMVRRVAPYGKDLAYLACSNRGIQLVHITENGVEKVASWEKECSYDVAVRDGTLYSLENNGELAVYEIQKGGMLKETGRAAAPWEIFFSFMISEDRNFAVCRAYGRLYFFDLSRRGGPKQVFFHSSGAVLYSDTLPEQDLGGVFPVNCHFAGVVWYDLSGKTPRCLGRIPGRLSGQMNGLTKVGKMFVLPLDSGNLAFLNPAFSRKSVFREIACPKERFEGIPSFDGDQYLVFSDRRRGWIRTYQFDGRDTVRLCPERTFSLPGTTPDRVAFLNGRMLIPGGYAGLLVEKRTQKSLPPSNPMKDSTVPRENR